jgi:hypothetical protein
MNQPPDWPTHACHGNRRQPAAPWTVTPTGNGWFTVGPVPGTVVAMFRNETDAHTFAANHNQAGGQA